MITTRLDLPARARRPRTRGLTMVVDPGLATRRFEDAVESYGDLIDLVKFGWGTALVTRDLKRKADALHEARIPFYCGGTLFERFAQEGLVADFRDLCRTLGTDHVEVSNGTIAMDDEEKAGWVAALSAEFTVISEVGAKDHARADAQTAEQWVAAIHADLAAGAWLVTTEARESGRSGICTAYGKPREEIVDMVLASGVDPDRLLFEAPTKDLQTYFVRRLGADVNLGNVASDDVVSCETLRLGLRSDTLPER